jgi:hypothetical protein
MHLVDRDTELSTGFWRKAAYLNHSCVPNCSRAFIGDMMIIRATCFIPAGTELTHQYLSPDETSHSGDNFSRTIGVSNAIVVFVSQKSDPQTLCIKNAVS